MSDDLKLLIAKAASGQSLTRDEAASAFDRMMSGEATPSQMGGLLMALRVRGETVDEITGAASTMRSKMTKVSAPPDAIDVVGTGGDASGSYNVSTCAALIVAGACLVSSAGLAKAQSYPARTVTITTPFAASSGATLLTRLLAEKLEKYANRNDVIVLGLPRGGVPVAYEVAKRLNAPLDVFIVRKLGVPGFEELAAGAIASGGVRVLNEDVVRAIPYATEAIEAVTAKETAELQRREQIYREGRPAPALRDPIGIRPREESPGVGRVGRRRVGPNPPPPLAGLVFEPMDRAAVDLDPEG